MKKYLLLVSVLVIVAIVVHGQSRERLPRYMIINNTKNMVELTLLNTINRDDLAIALQPKTSVANLFASEMISNVESLIPFPAVVIGLRATFYAEQAEWSTGSDALGVAYFPKDPGTMPMQDTIFILNGPDVQGLYSIDTQ